MSTLERLDEAVALTGLSAYGVRFSDLVVRYGEVVMLAGPNGSGKSTISRAVVGELAVAGSARVLDLDPIDDAADLKGRIGFLVKGLETMGSLTSRDVIDICAAVRGCSTSHAFELAERLGLDLDRPMAVLSRGQLRRLGIVQALMHKPELVVLDDPMTELDAPAREALPAVLREAAARGAAVLVTAQSPADAESFADRIVPLRTRPAEVPAPLFTPAEMVAEPTPSPRRRRWPAPDPTPTADTTEPMPSAETPDPMSSAGTSASTPVVAEPRRRPKTDSTARCHRVQPRPVAVRTSRPARIHDQRCRLRSPNRYRSSGNEDRSPPD